MAAKRTGKPVAPRVAPKERARGGKTAKGKAPVKPKGKDPVKPGRGRPKAAIDPQQVITMASYGCTAPEIAAVLGCSKDTLERRFKDELKTGRNGRNGMLRAKIFKLAGKSAAMGIFLAKNYLGLVDTIKYEKLTDEELIARAREEGIDPGTLGEAASEASAEETEPTN